MLPALRDRRLGNRFDLTEWLPYRIVRFLRRTGAQYSDRKVKQHASILGSRDFHSRSEGTGRRRAASAGQLDLVSARRPRFDVPAYGIGALGKAQARAHGDGTARLPASRSDGELNGRTGNSRRLGALSSNDRQGRGSMPGAPVGRTLPGERTGSS